MHAYLLPQKIFHLQVAGLFIKKMFLITHFYPLMKKKVDIYIELNKPWTGFKLCSIKCHLLLWMAGGVESPMIRDKKAIHYWHLLHQEPWTSYKSLKQRGRGWGEGRKSLRVFFFYLFWTVHIFGLEYTLHSEIIMCGYERIKLWNE